MALWNPDVRNLPPQNPSGGTVSATPATGYYGSLGTRDSFTSRADFDRYRASQQPAQPAAPSYWTPSEFNRPATAYPGAPATGTMNATQRRRARGGYGAPMGGYSGMAQNFESTASLGPGAYWPGHGADFQRESQMASLMPQLYQGYIGGQAQPGAMAAWLQYQNAGGTVGAARRAHGAQYGTYGMGGGSGGGAGSYQSAYDEARAENEARYRDALSGYQDRYVRNMEDLRGSGEQERRDINEAYDRQAADMRQSMQSRGLGNSTIQDTMAMGNERERIGDQGRLEERLRQQRIAQDASLSGDVLGFMERRTDSYPDLNLMSQLAQGLGQAGYGQPGGVGPGSAPQYLTTYGLPSGGGGGFVGMPVGYMGGGGGGASAARYAANRSRWANYNATRSPSAADRYSNPYMARYGSELLSEPIDPATGLPMSDAMARGGPWGWD